MHSETLRKFFDFTTALEGLKKIERYKGKFFWKDYPFPERFESVADHTWRLCMLVLLFEDSLSQPFNTEKALKIALMHDMAEIIAGDASPLGNDGTGNTTYAFDAKQAELRHHEEKAAAITLTTMLPEEKSKNFLDLWLEFEEQKSFEAQVIKSLDKLEALIQVLEYSDGNLFKEHMVFAERYSLKGSSVDPALEQFGQYIFSELKRRYKEFAKDIT